MQGRTRRILQTEGGRGKEKVLGARVLAAGDAATRDMALHFQAGGDGAPSPGQGMCLCWDLQFHSLPSGLILQAKLLVWLMPALC